MISTICSKFIAKNYIYTDKFESMIESCCVIVTTKQSGPCVKEKRYVRVKSNYQTDRSCSNIKYQVFF